MLAMSKRLNFKRFCVDLVCTVLPSENTDSDYCYCVLGLICLFLMLILFYEATNRKKFNNFFIFRENFKKKTTFADSCTVQTFSCFIQKSFLSICTVLNLMR